MISNVITDLTGGTSPAWRLGTSGLGDHLLSVVITHPHILHSGALVLVHFSVNSGPDGWMLLEMLYLGVAEAPPLTP